MAEIVNLRLARKARMRSKAALRATQNRVRFGRSSAEKSLTRAREEKRKRALESHRREPGRDPDGSR